MPINNNNNEKDKLSDKYIIEHCEMLKSENMPKFISSDSEKSLKYFIQEFDGNENIPSEKVDNFQSLWKDLLNDAITFLKSKDVREFRSTSNMKVQHKRDDVAFGTDKLFLYFREYQEFEALLYGADRFYRDHILHVFRVWILGLWLIEKFRSKFHWDFERLGIKKDKEFYISKDEVLAMWCIIALTHDLGYPLDKIKKVKTKINGMMSYFGGGDITEGNFQIPTHHHFINDFILKFISSKLIEDKKEKIFKTSLQSKYYLKFSKSFEHFDHGIISCVVLMKNLIYFLESDFDLSNPFKESEDARQYCIRREILRAIASHTCTDIYHLYPNSLSFILILADELQVWGRPTFADLKNGRKEVDISATCNVLTNKIEILLTAKEGGKEYFYNICKKWHLWLRSALDASNRNFEFCFQAIVEEKNEHKKYLFKAEKSNKIHLYIGKELADLTKELYKNN